MGDAAPPVGYALKHAQSLLHLRMEEALKPLGLTVSHYSCLYHLHLEPGISAAALARRTFVTRQSMNVTLRQFIDRGLVVRPDHVDTGRALPSALTSSGVDLLDSAQALVDAVERRMLAGLAPSERVMLGRALGMCVESLGG